MSDKFLPSANKFQPVQANHPVHQAMIEPLISLYQDGEAARSEQQLVEQYIAGCPACHTLFEQYAGVEDRLRAFMTAIPAPRLTTQDYSFLKNMDADRLPVGTGRPRLLPTTPVANSVRSGPVARRPVAFSAAALVTATALVVGIVGFLVIASLNAHSPTPVPDPQAGVVGSQATPTPVNPTDAPVDTTPALTTAASLLTTSAPTSEAVVTTPSVTPDAPRSPQAIIRTTVAAANPPTPTNPPVASVTSRPTQVTRTSPTIGGQGGQAVTATPVAETTIAKATLSPASIIGSTLTTAAAATTSATTSQPSLVATTPAAPTPGLPTTVAATTLVPTTAPATTVAPTTPAPATTAPVAATSEAGTANASVTTPAPPPTSTPVPSPVNPNAYGFIAYVDKSDGQIHLVRADGSDDEIAGDPDTYRGVVWEQLVWSNDARWLAVVGIQPGKAERSLFVIDAQNPHSIDYVTDGLAPAWSPDSRSIAYLASPSSVQNGVQRGRPAIVNLKKRTVEVVGLTLDNFGPQWFDDGSRLLLGQNRIYDLNTTQTITIKVFENEWIGASLSPVGNRLSVLEYSADGRFETVVYDLNHPQPNAKQPVVARAVAPVQGKIGLIRGASRLQWTPDSRNVYYYTTGQAGGFSTCLVSTAGGTRCLANVYQPSFTVDSANFVDYSPAAGLAYVGTTISGSRPAQPHSIAEAAFAPVWQPR